MDKKILEHINVGTRSPGPAAYCVKPTIGKNATDPSIEKNPAYSIGRKHKNYLRNNGPGPAYDTNGWSEYGQHRTPGGVFSHRFAGRAKAPTPGPADYSVKPMITRIGYRMGPAAVRRAERSFGPAPNAYTLPNALNGRSVQMSRRFPDKGVKYPTPGPGHYNSPHPDLYLPGTTRQGRSIAGRAKAKRVDDCTPGPANYNSGARVNCCARPRGVAQDCLLQPCRATFGKRGHEKVGIFAVPMDNEYNC